MPAPRFTATYRIRSDAASIAARAEAIAVEQSVEMPVSAIAEAEILRDIVGEVAAIEQRGDDLFDVRIALATATTGLDAGQFLNMVFGNTSLHADVVLLDVEIPADLATAFGGPRHGIDGLRYDSSIGDAARTTTDWRTSATRRSPNVSQQSPAASAARATCRACPAISTRCAASSTWRARMASARR